MTDFYDHMMHVLSVKRDIQSWEELAGAAQGIRKSFYYAMHAAAMLPILSKGYVEVQEEKEKLLGMNAALFDLDRVFFGAKIFANRDQKKVRDHERKLLKAGRTDEEIDEELEKIREAQKKEFGTNIIERMAEARDLGKVVVVFSIAARAVATYTKHNASGSAGERTEFLKSLGDQAQALREQGVTDKEVYKVIVEEDGLFYDAVNMRALIKVAYYGAPQP